MASNAALSELCDLIVDCPQSTPKWTKSGTLVLRSHNIRGGRLDLSDRSFTDEHHYKQRSRRAELRSGDLVITREAPMGEVCMIPEGVRCCLGQRMVLLRPNSRNCVPRFLLYALQSPHVQNQISWSEGTGSTVSNLRIPHLEALRIFTPPRDEQQTIAAVLGSLDDKIEQNRRTGAKLEGLARAVFKAWFVDFEPVKAKAAGATAFPGMPPETFAALPTWLVDSQLGPVPEGWEVTRWGEIASLEYGKGLKGYQEGVGRFQVFGTNGPIGWHTAMLAGGPGIIIGRKGAYRGVHYSTEPFWAIDTAFYLKPKRPFSWKWAYYELLRVDINGMDSGSAIPSTSREDFYSLPVCWPQLAMFHGFDAVFAPVFEKLVASDTESAKLATLRDDLLPRLLSGHVRVGDVLRTQDLKEVP